ncbi:MAG: hypothetical protein KAI02_03640 [Gammaproteobacteria bacterium]|nr:hypothetical protein [Gammaproteobacteria bacterium]
MLTKTEKQFIFKRSLFQKVAGYIAWSVGVSTALAWGIMFWFKPEMVNSQAVLALLKEKTANGYDLTPVTDIAVLAVTGATAMSVMFVLIILIAVILNSFVKKEKMYLSIIAHLEQELEKVSTEK